MIRTIPVAERNVYADPPNVVTVPAATATMVLAGEVYKKFEISGRYIQNVGANDLFFAFGDTVPNAANNYHGMLLASGQQQLDCSNNRHSVWVYSVAGTTVATTIFRRYDDPQ